MKYDIQNIIIIILIIIIIILCLIIGVHLLFKESSSTIYNEHIMNKNNNIEFFHKKLKKEEILNIIKTASIKIISQLQFELMPENKHQIHIAMAIDNQYIYPTLVSMASALYNNNNNENILVYHLLCSNEFNEENLNIFNSLKTTFNFSLNYYIIPGFFKKFRKWRGSSDTVYYKMLLPLLFYNLERIIYLDSDTLIYKDLYEMYNLPFNGNYVLGYPFHGAYKIDKFVNESVYYINGGVILFNNFLIRKDNKDLELIKFTLENNNKLWFLEQDAINIVFLNKIGILPLKYGIYMYGNVDTFEKKIQNLIRFKLNKSEVIGAIKDPSLVHFSGCYPKVWFNNSKNEFGVDKICERFHNDFYFYANKTDYYVEIYNNYMK